MTEFNAEINDNQEVNELFACLDTKEKKSIKHLTDAERRYIERQKVIRTYLNFYECLIKDTISKNNKQIYSSLTSFVKTKHEQLLQYASEANSKGARFKKDLSSQVPTALIVTSSESASSIDTQFEGLNECLEREIKALPILLDDKKCGTVK